ncbi:ATP-binding protein [Sphingomonas solaris]|uniref:ATP-binding protein n=1 Tax=Alterirhizorhabdus solaris TaxID=2529389 RepID=A0A558R9H6_9SPHN|nr:ATP-binding protein [Sphingomonas solaris]TVV76037.1 ATP-binding protein [Sphingomonas solaris]
MLQISRDDIDARLALDNPWWDSDDPSSLPTANLPERVYLAPFCKLALNFRVKRAAILMGPRRVGKTVMIRQLAAKALEQGMPGSNILYASIDTPLYSNQPLSFFVDAVLPASRGEQCLIMFDEIQYLRDWQVHLKDLVDTYPNVRFVASGSAAAALKLRSQESGAGRFSDFVLPPLTFSEYVDFSGNKDLVQQGEHRGWYHCQNIQLLNKLFIDYLNYGGYPEAVFNEEVRRNPDRFIRSDIVEKVLLNDLPSLYGINNIQELKKLFMFLAYNAGHEASYEGISQESGISKNIVRTYIEYLESAFLIIKLPTVNESCRSMQRERNFKVYLSNPSMRAALFTVAKETDHSLIGHLAESAVFSQWQHSLSFSNLRYARWRGGEVDVVSISEAEQKAQWAGEIKWSDRIAAKPEVELKHLRVLLSKQPKTRAVFFTTKTVSLDDVYIEGRKILILPTSLYCYTVGKNAAQSAKKFAHLGVDDHDEDSDD